MKLEHLGEDFKILRLEVTLGVQLLAPRNSSDPRLNQLRSFTHFVLRSPCVGNLLRQEILAQLQFHYMIAFFCLFKTKMGPC